MTLSTNQESIVNAPIGSALQVLASAGSGKTRVLTERIRFILENTKKDSVIALTFTNKAAEEMAERLDNVDAIEDRAWVATIHSVAQRILEQYGHTIGLPSELHIYEREKDRMEVFLQSLRDDNIDIDEYLDVSDSREKRNREGVMQKYMDVFAAIKREILNESEVIEKYPKNLRLWKIYQDYQDALLASGGIDYDDILKYAYKILLLNEWVANIYRAKYKHVCVDEAQDLNKIQYEFIKALCGESITSVLMVGDPNQMIYGFNGSSSEYLCSHFIADFKPSVYELKENYRSSKAVIHAANKLKPGSQKESDFALQGGVTIEAQANEFDEAGWVVGQIKYLLELKTHKEIEGEITLDKMVVIARNRYIFSALEDALKNADIRFSLKKGERQVEPSSLFCRVLDYAIRVKLNPKDWVDGKKLCALLKLSSPSEWGNDEILSKWSQDTLTSEIIFPELQSELLEAIDQLDVDEPNIRKLTTLFIEKLEDVADDVQLDEYESELEISILELKEFQKYWTRFRQKGLGDSLQAFRNAMALGQLTEEVINDGLTLSTVHTMKGLEKDIVFLMTMCEGVFPDYRAKTTADINEERNNAFVAVTRAKRWLYISYPTQRTMPWGGVKGQAQSRFIAEIQG
ncbi:MAG: ATP-dependent helicase [Methyloprofundus sp.]|nr:ATP-dependent helicase [Methyloprofundus sp.]